MRVLTLPRYGQTIIRHDVYCFSPLLAHGFECLGMPGEGDTVEDGCSIVLHRYYVSVLEIWRIDNLKGARVRKIAWITGTRVHTFAPL
jgi:hypothetical protein